MRIVRTVSDLRAVVQGWRGAGEGVALVPTMGALHEGHLTLVRRARERVRRVVVSLFVNPTQFAPSEDFTAYPRDEAGDAAKLAEAGVDLLFAPSVATMYPPGDATAVSVARLSAGLCGPWRPGHFQGVATVVTKLLAQCLPDVAAFGEKDYQQLQVIKRLARDLHLPVEILGVATVREPSGLALSSRNAYLSVDERKIAARVYQVIGGMAARLAKAPAEVAKASAAGRAALLAAGFATVEYLEVCDAKTLQPLTVVDRPARVLVAARLGKTRLIDNVPVVPAT
ncbi:MAG: pantoate--beta-alanine ligase [Alphaproteobacteria bacterium]|nr:pantoate--beta-alanine ligase [Alphaproteobacteria bacterium]